MDMLEMTFQPPIAKGILTTFDVFCEDLQKISAVSAFDKFDSQTGITEMPIKFQKALHLFSNITEDSTEEDCSTFMKLMKDLPTEMEFVGKFEKTIGIMDVCSNFQKFRDLVKHKLSIPVEIWKKEKQDSIQFPEAYVKLAQELDDVRHAVENANIPTDKIRDQEAQGEKCKEMKPGSEDLKSLYPFSIIANAEEHMQRISVLREKKMQVLQEQLKMAEQTFQSATVKYREEIEYIIQETLKTKSFIEWLEKKNHCKLNDYESKMKEEWSEFSREIEESRKLSKIYVEKQVIYLGIEKEKDKAERERQEKLKVAAITIQKRWRYIKERRMRGNTKL